LRSGATARVLALLNADGEEARVAGGAVRNALLGLPVGDIDIATTALPDEVIRRAKAAHIKSVPTGVEHGTVTGDRRPAVRSHHASRRHRDFRTQGQGGVRTDWTRDAMRRDFTMNGLFATADGVVHDEVGGLADIDARRVRFIGDPAQRIAEDYLRILRFFRIHAAYGEGAPDAAGYEACIAGRDGLTGLSAERIRMEMLKLMIAKGAAEALVAMDDAGLLLRLTAGVVYHGAFANMLAAEHALGIDPDAIRRLGALAVAVTEDAKRLSLRWRLSNVEAKRLDSMGHRWWRMFGMDEVIAQRRLYRLGAPRYRDRMMLAWARSGRDFDAPQWRDLTMLPERWTAPAFPLKAVDFIARGIAEGPALGHVLALAEDAWLALQFPLDDAALKAIADDTVARFTRDHRL
jgi:poly(A) polymerase/tRNA nucleotidyltransferase (CCA-adding enzyme)